MMDIKIGEIQRGKELGLSPYNKYIWVACELCGQERWVRIEAGQARSRLCSNCILRGLYRQRYQGNHPNWDGGEHCGANGYVVVAQPNHPHCQKGGYIYKHRLVMEASLGRYLDPEEVVHHLDGNKRNNEFSNLMLLECNGLHRTLHKRG